MLSEEHACFWRNTHGSEKDMRVSRKTSMDPEKTSVLLEKQAWIWKRHACFRKNKDGPGKDMRVSGKTRVAPEKTCVFPEKQAWTRKRQACFQKNRRVSDLTGIPHAKKYGDSST